MEFDVTAKLHGPSIPLGLAEHLENYLKDLVIKHNGISQVTCCEIIAKEIIEKFGDGDNILWAEVEYYLVKHNTMFSSSAEKVSV